MSQTARILCKCRYSRYTRVFNRCSRGSTGARARAVSRQSSQGASHGRTRAVTTPGRLQGIIRSPGPNGNTHGQGHGTRADECNVQRDQRAPAAHRQRYFPCSAPDPRGRACGCSVMSDAMSHRPTRYCRSNAFMQTLHSGTCIPTWRAPTYSNQPAHSSQSSSDSSHTVGV